MSSSTLERTTRTAERERSGADRAARRGTPTTGARGATTGRAAPAAPRTAPRPSAARSRARSTQGADTSGGTAPFVLLIMVLLTTGLVATLWLSTAAAADSYRLDAAHQATRDRSEEVERLHRDVAAMQSAPCLLYTSDAADE